LPRQSPGEGGSLAIRHSSLENPFVIYLAAPNFLAFDLRTCPESFRGKSASEVAKIDNGTNNSLNEGP